MKKWILVLIFIALFTTCAGAQANQPYPQLRERTPPICAQRDKSVSLEECEARIALINGQHFKECEGLTGHAYEACVVKVPSRLNPPKSPKRGAEPVHNSYDQYLRDKLKKEREADDKALEDADKNLQKVNAEYASVMAQADEEESKQRSCLLRLHVGSRKAEVLACGQPDHINADLHEQQWVYPNRTYIYLKKGVVVDLQWTE